MRKNDYSIEKMRLILACLFAASAVAHRIPTCPRPVPGNRNVPDFLPYDTIPVPGYCNRYYKCESDGRAVELQCPSGQEFNPLTRSCGAPTALCGNNLAFEPVVENRVHDHLCLGKLNGQKIATDNCNSFVTCNGGFGHLQSCDTGLLFNQTAGYCDWPENVRCNEWVGPLSGAAPSCEGKNGQMIRNPYDCSSFYYCENSNALLYYCAQGLHFDANIKACNWKESVDCSTDGKPEVSFRPVSGNEIKAN